MKKILFIILFIVVMCFVIIGWPWHNVPATNADMNKEIGVDTSGSNSDSPVPEPITLVMVGSGLIGLAVIGRKRFKK